jgi:folylpolyglutamate synthase
MNGEPISEEKFTKYFFEVWNKVESTAEKKHPKSPRRPQYFRFLTLLSYYIFLKERVDIVIYEVGIGGERDGTNILEQPAVTGVSSLEIHHVDALGDTLESVAAIKAGIFRKGCPAFTVEQDPEAFESLERRADDKDVHLATVATHPGLKDVSIKPAECFQFKNASLAIALAEVALKKVGVSVDHVEGLPEQFIQGLETLAWRGTREVLIRDQLQWHLDVADTKKSLMGASSWFANIPNEK